jgi:hypothetical protein
VIRCRGSGFAAAARRGVRSFASRARFAAVLAALCGCVQPQAVTLPAIPAGDFRLCIYREYEPFETLARPYVRINGGIVGISDPGGAFHRDLPPGTYHVTVDTVGHDVNQFADVTAATGQTVYIQVESSRLWESDLNYTANTFYTRVISPGNAETKLAAARFCGGSTGSSG